MESLEEARQRDLLRLAERNTLVIALQGARMVVNATTVVAASASGQWREQAFADLRAALQRQEEAEQALAAYDQQARQRSF